MNAVINTNNSKRASVVVIRGVQKRNENGSSLLEIPVSLWVTIMVLFMPMLSLASITLQSALAGIAVQDAVQSAAKARTFQQASPEGGSAMELGTSVFQQHLQAFPGVKLNSFDLDILATNLNNGTVVRSENQLQLPADTSANVYQIEGSCTATIDPLFPGQIDELRGIPGLTKPMLIGYSARQMFENPQGLNR